MNGSEGAFMDLEMQNEFFSHIQPRDPPLPPDYKHLYKEDYEMMVNALSEEANIPHVFFSDEGGRKEALSVRGNMARIRHHLHQHIYEGRNLTVAFLGGSITFSESPDGLTFPQWFETILRKSPPFQVPAREGRLRVFNCGVPATSSSYMNLCHRIRVPSDVDIAFIEYSRNDFDGRQALGLLEHPLHRTYERLIRKLLTAYAHHPAVVLYHVYVPPGNRPFKPDDDSETVEPNLELFADHYGLKSVSVKKAVWRKARDNITGFVTHDSTGRLCSRHWAPPKKDVDKSWKDKGAWLQGKVFYQDAGYHADAHTGLRLMGELAAEVLFQGLSSLNSTPYSDKDVSAFNATLTIPAPLISGNYEAHSERCFIEHKLNEMSVKQGFSFTDEERGWGKWGLLSYQPGSFITITFDSTLPSRDFANDTAAVRVAYLKSYSDVMGIMKIECIDGCSCQPATIDTHHTKGQHFSIMSLHLIHVTQSKMCKMSITVLNETSSKGHKVKVLGLMSSEDPIAHHWVSEGIELPNDSVTAFAGRLARRIIKGLY